MIDIKRLTVDTVHKNLIVSANLTPSTSDKYYKFIKICIDSSKTFNCKSEESTKATIINPNTAIGVNLVNKEISFNDILIDNIEEELLFIWIYEREYTTRTVYKTVVVDEDDSLYVYIEDADGYHKIDMTNLPTEFNTRVQMLEASSPSGGSQDYEVDCVNFDRNKYTYFRIYDIVNDEYYYYKMMLKDSKCELIKPEEFPDTESTVYDETGNPDNCAFGMTLAVREFYNLILNHIDIISNDSCDCKTDCSDVNFMLAWNGFNLAKMLLDYPQVIKYWDILHSQGTDNYISSCNCNK